MFLIICFIPLRSYYFCAVQLFTESSDVTNTVDSEDDIEINADEPNGRPPQTRNKRGSKKTRAQESQAPVPLMSPTRPPTKRMAPNSPNSPTKQTAPKGKKVKQSSQDPSKKGKGKAQSSRTSGSGRSTTAGGRPVPASSMSAPPANVPAAPVLPSLMSVSAPPALLVAVPSPPVHVAAPIHDSSEHQGEDRDVLMIGPETATDVQPQQDDPVDQIAQMMLDDPDWQKDPDELDQMAELGLKSCPSTPKSSSRLSPLSSLPPTSPPVPVSPKVMPAGVKSRTNSHLPNVAVGPSSRPVYRPDVESIAGIPLIPSGRGSFKSGIRQGRSTKKR